MSRMNILYEAKGKKLNDPKEYDLVLGLQVDSKHLSLALSDLDNARKRSEKEYNKYVKLVSITIKEVTENG